MSTIHALPEPRTEVVDQATRLRAMVDALPINPAQVACERAAREARGPIVAITSGKGGVGKTFASVNLSIALARLGCRVTLIDADPGLANADVMCGVAPVNRPGDRAGSLDQLAVEAPGGFRLIPGVVGTAASGVADDHQLARRFRGVASGQDVVLVDTGAGLAPGVLASIACADLVLVVVTPEPTAIAGAYAMIKCVQERVGNPPRRASEPATRIGIIVNQAASRGEARVVHARLAEVCERFLRCSPMLLGVVSQDDRVRRSIRSRRPLLTLKSPSGPAAREVQWLGLRLASELGLHRPEKQGPEGLIARWRRRLALESASSREST